MVLTGLSNTRQIGTSQRASHSARSLSKKFVRVPRCKEVRFPVLLCNAGLIVLFLRNSFPRFFFISDDELLSILGSTDVSAVQDNMIKMFDNIACLRFGTGRTAKVAAIIAWLRYKH